MDTVSDLGLQHLLDILSSPDDSPTQRVIAITTLAAWSEPVVLEALLCIAQNENEERAVSRAAGESVARIVLRKGSVDQVPLYDFSEHAFLGYDEAISRHQRSSA